MLYDPVVSDILQHILSCRGHCNTPVSLGQAPSLSWELVKSQISVCMSK